MEEKTILDRVSELVEEEHRLRSAVMTGDISSDEEQSRLKRLEIELDQCWDLLRRRRATGDTDLRARPAEEVEGYLQ